MKRNTETTEPNDAGLQRYLAPSAELAAILERNRTSDSARFDAVLQHLKKQGKVRLPQKSKKKEHHHQ